MNPTHIITTYICNVHFNTIVHSTPKGCVLFLFSNLPHEHFVFHISFAHFRRPTYLPLLDFMIIMLHYKFDRLCGLMVRVRFPALPDFYITILTASVAWLQIQRSGFDSRRYQVF
jgi:hypothetical protein